MTTGACTTGGGDHAGAGSGMAATGGVTEIVGSCGIGGGGDAVGIGGGW